MHKPPRERITIPPGKKLIFRATRREGGRVLVAKAFGLRAWPILVDE